MDNSDWRKHQKEHWPEGSLERSLLRNYPGCKTAVEALNKALKAKTPLANIVVEHKPVETEREKYVALRDAISSTAHYVHHGFDTWLVPEEVRKRLNDMPINSVAEALFFRDAWVKEIRKIKEQK